MKLPVRPHAFKDDRRSVASFDGLRIADNGDLMRTGPVHARQKRITARSGRQREPADRSAVHSDSDPGIESGTRPCDLRLQIRTGQRDTDPGPGPPETAFFLIRVVPAEDLNARIVKGNELQSDLPV